MSLDSVRYYRIKRGRGYWCPTKRMREDGFDAVSCGPDGPKARKIAARRNAQWDWHRRKLKPENCIPATAETLARRDIDEAALSYPEGSCGDLFRQVRESAVWTTKGPRTQEDFWRAWRYLRPVFGDVDPNSLGLQHWSKFRSYMLATAGLRETYRTTKCWRWLWTAWAGLRAVNIDADPSLAVRNQAPPPRDQRWNEGEIVRLVKHAWRSGYHGLALLIAIAWDTMFSPVDVRTLTLSQGQGPVGKRSFSVARAKTGKPAIGTLSARTERLLAEYLSRVKRKPSFTEPFIQNRAGAAYRRDTLARVFRIVRRAVFGANECRTIADMRRSGAVEAVAGSVSNFALSSKMANTISSSNQLAKTYAPVDIAAVRVADAARRIGRERMRQERDRNESAVADVVNLMHGEPAISRDSEAATGRGSRSAGRRGRQANR